MTAPSATVPSPSGAGARWSDAFSPSAISRLFPEAGEAASILAIVNDKLGGMVERVRQGLGTQRLDVGYTSGLESDRDRAVDRTHWRVIKARSCPSSGIEALIYRYVGEGAWKHVFGKARCVIGEHPVQDSLVTAYAKIPTLKWTSRRLRSVEKLLRETDGGTSIIGQQRKDLERDLEACLRRISELTSVLRNEAAMAQKTPYAVRMHIRCRRSDPEAVKGLEMEYVSEGSLRCYLQSRHLPPHYLMMVASRVCSVVSLMHEAGILHGDISLSNILLRQEPKGEMPLSVFALTDFSMAQQLASDNQCTCVVSTFPPPEMFRASEKLSVTFSRSMDSWSLGIAVLEIVYGIEIVIKLCVLFHSQEGPHHPWEWADVSRHIMKQPVVFFEVNAVIENLMTVNPKERWAARRAAEELQRIAELQQSADAKPSAASPSLLEGTP